MGKTYAEKLRDPRWQKKRLQILERDNWTCQLCQDTKTMLAIHHLKYTGDNPWEAPDKDLITYCDICHGLIEFIKINSYVYSINTILKIKVTPDIILLSCKLDVGIAFYQCFIDVKPIRYEGLICLVSEGQEQLKKFLNG